MAAVKDPYKLLVVDKKDSQDEIKKAYRKLARQYHPDRNPDDSAAETRFKEISSAYDTIGDSEKRKAHDRQAANPFAGASPFGGGFGGGGGATGGGGGFADA